MFRIKFAALKSFAVVAATALGALSCASDACREGFKVDLKSPEEYLVATVFVRECGAFTESVTHVNLRDRGEKPLPDAKGVISAGEVFAVEGHHSVYLIWKDERHLSIKCVGCGTNRILKKESSWREVQISYTEG